MDDYKPKCPKHKIPLREVKGAVYRSINILQGCPKYRVFRCTKRFCNHETTLQQD